MYKIVIIIVGLLVFFAMLGIASAIPTSKKMVLVDVEIRYDAINIFKPYSIGSVDYSVEDAHVLEFPLLGLVLERTTIEGTLAGKTSHDSSYSFTLGDFVEESKHLTLKFPNWGLLSGIEPGTYDLHLSLFIDGELKDTKTVGVVVK